MTKLDDEVKAAAAALRKPGAVLLVPTETVYGLVCRWSDAAGRARIYELKGRDHGKPLAMFARDVAMARAAGARPTDAGSKLLAHFSPGPITVIVPGEGADTVGIRIPDYDFILRLLELLNEPLASTSANASGRPNVLTVAAALAELRGAVALAVDHGAIPENRQASTVVDATGTAIRVLRPGPIEAAELERVLSA